MNTNLSQAQQALQYAYDALRGGDQKVARRWAGQAAKLAPQLEDPWLILASVSEPNDSIKYLETALQINPDSPRARKGMAWAQKRLATEATARVKPEKRKRAARPARKAKGSKISRKFVIPVLFIMAGCLVILLAGWTAITNPVVASMLRAGTPTQAVHPKVWAQVPIAKPTHPVGPVPAVVQAQPTATLPLPTATSEPTQAPTEIPTDQPTEAPTQTPEVESTPEEQATPGQLAMEIVESTAVPTLDPAAPKKPSSSSSGSNNGGRWIEVNLSEQMVYAWEGNTLMNSFLASTGTWATPTVTGTFKIWNKTRIQAMSGPGYYLPDVPWVMYFYKDYGFHGTYWHNNFGTPMSHGCVNLTIPAAEWLYNFGYIGMTVNVHY